MVALDNKSDAAMINGFDKAIDPQANAREVPH